MRRPELRGQNGNGSAEQLAVLHFSCPARASRRSWTTCLVGATMTRRTLSAELAVPTTRQEDMRHPSHVWVDLEYAKEPLDKLRLEYVEHLRGRSNPAA